MLQGLTHGCRDLVAKTLRRCVIGALVFCSGAANATLLGRGPNMVYDDVLDITWTRQAGDGTLRDWADANTWAAGFSINDPTYGLIDNWRLPYASVSAPNGGVGPITTLTIGFPCTGAGGADETACRDNEMAYMFYYNLDGNQFDNKTGNQTALGGEMLTGIQPSYWSGSEFSSFSAWNFGFNGGGQLNVLKEDGVGVLNVSYAWAVRPGDVAAVPEPASLLLLGLGALGFGVARRNVRRR